MTAASGPHPPHLEYRENSLLVYTILVYTVASRHCRGHADFGESVMTNYSKYYSGKELYGDDFTPEQIRVWFEEEESGYYQLATASQENPQENYPYHGLNETHGYRFLRSRTFRQCLGLGVGGGHDVRPIAAQVERFYCIEPGKAWWRDELFGKPATFAMPQPDGTIELGDSSCDLAVSLGVLHHIPNVTAVLTELSRVLMSSGLLVLREPIVTMGEWGKPRGGLTKNERGLPLTWLRERMHSLGFETVNEQLCAFQPFIVGMARLLNKKVYSSVPLTRVDALLSDLTAFNTRYYRPTFLGKFAPAAIFGVYRKR